MDVCLSSSSIEPAANDVVTSGDDVAGNGVVGDERMYPFQEGKATGVVWSASPVLKPVMARSHSFSYLPLPTDYSSVTCKDETEHRHSEHADSDKEEEGEEKNTNGTDIDTTAVRQKTRIVAIAAEPMVERKRGRKKSRHSASVVTSRVPFDNTLRNKEEAPPQGISVPAAYRHMVSWRDRLEDPMATFMELRSILCHREHLKWLIMALQRDPEQTFMDRLALSIVEMGLKRVSPQFRQHLMLTPMEFLTAMCSHLPGMSPLTCTTLRILTTLAVDCSQELLDLNVVASAARHCAETFPVELGRFLLTVAHASSSAYIDDQTVSSQLWELVRINLNDRPDDQPPHPAIVGTIAQLVLWWTECDSVSASHSPGNRWAHHTPSVSASERVRVISQKDVNSIRLARLGMVELNRLFVWLWPLQEELCLRLALVLFKTDFSESTSIQLSEWPFPFTLEELELVWVERRSPMALLVLAHLPFTPEADEAVPPLLCRVLIDEKNSTDECTAIALWGMNERWKYLFQTRPKDQFDVTELRFWLEAAMSALGRADSFRSLPIAALLVAETVTSLRQMVTRLPIQSMTTISRVEMAIKKAQN